MVSIAKLKEIELIDKKDFERLKSRFGTAHPKEFGEEEVSKGVDYLNKQFAKLKEKSKEKRIGEEKIGFDESVSSSLWELTQTIDISRYGSKDVDEFVKQCCIFEEKSKELEQFVAFLSFTINKLKEDNPETEYEFNLDLTEMNKKGVFPDYFLKKIHDVKVNVTGRVGHSFGYFMNNCHVGLGIQNLRGPLINSNIVAENYLGRMMKDSRIAAYGSVGNSCGIRATAEMKGLQDRKSQEQLPNITIFGNAGDFLADEAERLHIVVHGSAGNYAGKHSVDIELHILTGVKDYLGAGMYSGRIVVGSETKPAEHVGKQIGRLVRYGAESSVDQNGKVKAEIIIYYKKWRQIKRRIAKGRIAPAKDGSAVIKCVYDVIMEETGRSIKSIILWPPK